ncbi:MAG: NADH-quinone oxidoreductase subunit A [Bdellovibrionales bacterium]|nr:NADH-quinone oxidoreductase subunit A [Bdellovibrionales bacterium]
MSELVPVLVLSGFVIIFGLLIVGVASLLGPKIKKIDPTKFEPYECGLKGEGAESTRIPVKYYLTAILFILFDIEIIFMYPWAISYGDFIADGKGIYIFAAMAIFLAVFIVGLFWEIKSKALEWD